MPYNARTIEFLRVGNPWLVGRHVNRIVPVYVLHNLLEPDVTTSKTLQAAKDLAFNAALALTTGLSDKFEVAESDFGDLQQTVYGLISPERRIFRHKATGGSSKQGSPFPIVGGFVAATASDDGLGKRIRELLERHSGTWRQRLALLASPTTLRDPATSFGQALVGSTVAKASSNKTQRAKLGVLDKACVDFIDNLTIGTEDASRIPTLRRLAYGAYFVAIIRMVAGPLFTNDKRPLVFVYGGMPPGAANDPLIRAASKSYSAWIGDSWNASAQTLAREIASKTILPRTRKGERLRQQLHVALAERLAARPKEAERVIEAMEPILQDAVLTPDWCREAMESEIVGFSRAEFARRVRSLGANIGFAGPDRGLKPRLMLDTPLLSVLVRGVVGDQHMEFPEFISTLAKKFGLVLGIGSDEAVIDEIGALGSEGVDAYELLVRNEELLRERMLRAGLARAYSDLHTEVFCNV